MALNFKNTATVIFSFVLLVLFGQLHAKAPVLSAKQIENPPPRIIRTCCSFGANMGFVGIPFAKKTDISSPSGIGPHVYLGDKEEKTATFTPVGAGSWILDIYAIVPIGRPFSMN